MVRAISFHAIERLQERRSCEHLLRHINKIKKWNMPDNGEYIHKGYKYITKNGIVVTCYPDRKAMREVMNGEH